jgi:hypothetical protein
MDQMPSNDPVMESKPGIAGWFQVWMKAVTKPNEQTFIEISEDPNASSRNAYIWVFVMGTITAIVQTILRAIYLALGIAPAMPGIPTGLEEFTTQSLGDSSALISLAVGLCLSPLGGGLAVLFFALYTAIVQWIAKLFGGLGTYDKLLYVFAAISVPVSLVTLVLTMFSAIPFVGICLSVFSLGISIYALVLQVMAVKGVNCFDWGKAVGSVLIPIFVLFLFFCCIAFVVSMAIGAAFSGGQFAP